VLTLLGMAALATRARRRSRRLRRWACAKSRTPINRAVCRQAPRDVVIVLAQVARLRATVASRVIGEPTRTTACAMQSIIAGSTKSPARRRPSGCSCRSATTSCRWI